MTRKHVEAEKLLRAENEQLRKALQECADDLECELQNRYEGVLDYPSMKHKFERDMEPVIRARVLLRDSA